MGYGYRDVVPHATLQVGDAAAAARGATVKCSSSLWPGGGSVVHGNCTCTGVPADRQGVGGTGEGGGHTHRSTRA